VQFIDEGDWKGTRLFTKEAEKGLQLMQSLSPELKAKAQIFKRMHDPAMPEERWHPADEVSPTNHPPFPSLSLVPYLSPRSSLVFQLPYFMILTTSATWAAPSTTTA